MKKDHSSYTMILLKVAMLIGNLHRSLSYYFISPIIVHFHELSHTYATNVIISRCEIKRHSHLTGKLHLFLGTSKGPRTPGLLLRRPD